MRGDNPRLLFAIEGEMIDGFLALSLLAQLWLVYAACAAALIGGAAALEFLPARRVDGAGGWMLFGALMLSFWGLLLTAIVSVVILLVRAIL